MRVLIVVTALASCGGDAPSGGNQAIPVQPSASNTIAAAPDSLVGRYRSESRVGPSELCVVERGKRAQFGLVLRLADNRSCSGSGTLLREGTRLRLKMDGDSSCTVEADLDGTTIRLSRAQADGCAYYCAPGASFTAVGLPRRGASEVEAMKALDLVGEPLCAGA